MRDTPTREVIQEVIFTALMERQFKEVEEAGGALTIWSARDVSMSRDRPAATRASQSDHARWKELLLYVLC